MKEKAQSRQGQRRFREQVRACARGAILRKRSGAT